MKHRMLILLALVFLGLVGCKKSTTSDQSVKSISVLFNDIPYKTEKYLRIPYALQTWEYGKDGLKLQSITILDGESQVVLLKMDSSYADFPKIYKDSVFSFSSSSMVKVPGYYMSIQLPIPLAQAPPASVIHRFEFKDTIQHKTVVYNGPVFAPRLNETPIAISPPVKGENWMFASQSTNGYHFNDLLLSNGKFISPERFAWDNIQYNNEFQTFVGDPKINESYFDYGDTLYAVLGGRVVLIQDGLAENSGNAHDVTLHSFKELDGNYLVLDIGGGHFAYYCHCIPHSFMVKPGDTLKDGAPLALLGNSGNSYLPHLHFQVCDSPEGLNSTGLPCVLKQYIKIADGPPPHFITPETYTNAMMEHLSMVRL